MYTSLHFVISSWNKTSLSSNARDRPLTSSNSSFSRSVGISMGIDVTSILLADSWRVVNCSKEFVNFSKRLFLYSVICASRYRIWISVNTADDKDLLVKYSTPFLCSTSRASWAIGLIALNMFSDGIFNLARVVSSCISFTIVPVLSRWRSKSNSTSAFSSAFWRRMVNINELGLFGWSRRLITLTW